MNQRTRRNGQTPSGFSVTRSSSQQDLTKLRSSSQPSLGKKQPDHVASSTQVAQDNISNKYRGKSPSSSISSKSSIPEIHLQDSDSDPEESTRNLPTSPKTFTSPPRASPGLNFENIVNSVDIVNNIQTSVLNEIPALEAFLQKTANKLLSKTQGSREEGRSLMEEAIGVLKSFSNPVKNLLHHIGTLELALNIKQNNLNAVNGKLLAQDKTTKELSLKLEELAGRNEENIRLQTALTEENELLRIQLTRAGDHSGEARVPSNTDIAKSSDLKRLELKIASLEESIGAVHASLSNSLATSQFPINQPSISSNNQYSNLSVSNAFNSKSNSNHQLEDNGVIIITPRIKDPAWSSNVKCSLNSLELENLIIGTRDTRSGDILVRSKEESSLPKLMETISSNDTIKTTSWITTHGPRKTSLIIKSLPSNSTDEAILSALHRLGSRNPSLGKRYYYVKSSSFSQSIDVEQQLARFLLSSASPSLQVGNCSHPISPFVPHTRCQNCQEIGHSTSNCRLRGSICGFCARPGHSSQQCRVKNDFNQHYCYNCHIHNSNVRHEDELLDPGHPASSRDCPSFRSYVDMQQQAFRAKLFNINCQHLQ